MQSTIAAVDRLAQTADHTERLARNYRAGYEDGKSHGLVQGAFWSLASVAAIVAGSLVVILVR